MILSYDMQFIDFSFFFHAMWICLVKIFKHQQLLLNIKNAKCDTRITGAKAVLYCSPWTRCVQCNLCLWAPGVKGQCDFPSWSLAEALVLYTAAHFSPAFLPLKNLVLLCSFWLVWSLGTCFSEKPSVWKPNANGIVIKMISYFYH